MKMSRMAISYFSDHYCSGQNVYLMKNAPKSLKVLKIHKYKQQVMWKMLWDYLSLMFFVEDIFTESLSSGEIPV